MLVYFGLLIQMFHSRSKMGEDGDTNEFLKTASAREAIDVLMEMSRLLNTGLDKETLIICVQLLESGVNPEALASVVTTLRNECAKLNSNQ